MTNTLSMMDIYSEYVKRRQGGNSMDDVVRELQPFADHLGKSERRQLGQLVQTWEANDGQHYKPIKHQANPPDRPAGGPAPFGTSPSPVRPISPGTRAGVHPIEPIGPGSDPSQRQACPNCGKPNHKKDTYCYSCGHILATKAPGTKSLEEEMNAEMRWGTAHFGSSSVMLFWVRGAPKPIELEPRGELIIGRSAEQSAMQPDIDLAAYKAEDLGVSRLHAAIKRMDNTVAITDLNSKNSTYINGQRLHAHEVRVLRDGDEIRLGRLAVKVSFKHQIRRI